MLAEDVYGSLRTYINQTLVGMGALKGASAQLSNVYDSTTGTNTMTWKWEDNNGVEHTTTVVVHDGATGATGATGPQGPAGADGAPGTDGAPGADGFSPVITIKTDTSSEYVLHIETADDEFDTPNLKGGGGSGGAEKLSQLTDVAISSVQDGNILQYNQTTQKWINTFISTMTGATASAAGTKGLVPAPAAGDNEKLFCGNGTYTDKILSDAQYAALQTLFT